MYYVRNEDPSSSSGQVCVPYFFRAMIGYRMLWALSILRRDYGSESNSFSLPRNPGGDQARSDLRHASIDEEFNAGHVAAVVRCEEDDRFSDLIGRAQPAEGDAAGEARLHLLDLLFGLRETA